MFSILMMGLFVISCSNDDDSSDNNNVDRIVGTWKVSDVKLNGLSVYFVLSQMQEAACILETEIQANNDYTAVIKTYMQNPDSTNIDCLAGPEETGTWTKQEDDTYIVSYNGQEASQEIDFNGNNEFDIVYMMEGEPYVVTFERQ